MSSKPTSRTGPSRPGATAALRKRPQAKGRPARRETHPELDDAKARAQEHHLHDRRRRGRAPENAMLVDAAKDGDVEILVPLRAKTGQPGRRVPYAPLSRSRASPAQTGCSTPVRDGMVVSTQTERVKEAQRSVVEFLLINHPSDRPSATRGVSARCRHHVSAGVPGSPGSSSPSATSSSHWSCPRTIVIDRERCIRATAACASARISEDAPARAA